MGDLWSDSSKLHHSFGVARFALQILESKAIKWFCDPKMRKICEANFSTQNSKGILIVALQSCGCAGALLRHTAKHFKFQRNLMYENCRAILHISEQFCVPKLVIFAKVDHQNEWGYNPNALHNSFWTRQDL
ncbi:MAG: hypothetical protein A7315_04780 [Candidatus Altiarchaeales archaeon WOR_SM1_79]|nr:MAG: hypothetical protein A7315_04780 [Candidatus Altiarchaeales archaeon WOR_SM1_79]